MKRLTKASIAMLWHGVGLLIVLLPCMLALPVYLLNRFTILQHYPLLGWGCILIMLLLFCIGWERCHKQVRQLKRRWLERYGISVSATITSVEEKITQEHSHYVLQLTWQAPDNRTYTFSEEHTEDALAYPRNFHMPVLLDPEDPTFYLVLATPVDVAETEVTNSIPSYRVHEA
ncbi:MAG TPA: hypothetical protein VL461_09225 [Dictyobacter sp.]|jgi:hypothetical protein|nr:hypothetical protein [Dictyobacter sp.]